MTIEENTGNPGLQNVVLCRQSLHTSSFSTIC